MQINHGQFMKRIIVFFNAGAPVVVNVIQGITTIVKEYPNGEQVHLPIMSAEFSSLTGDRKIVHVASDRELTSEDILNAAAKLL